MIEVGSEKEVIRLYIWCTNEKAVAVILPQADIYALPATMWCTLLNCLIEDGGMPTELASRVKEHIAQGRIEGMRI